MLKSKWQLISRKGKNFENFFLSIVALGLTQGKKIIGQPLQLVVSAYLQAGDRVEVDATKGVVRKL